MSDRMGLRRVPPCPHASPMAQRALTSLLTLAAERVFERLREHAAEGVSGCDYLAELTSSLLSMLVVLVSRQGGTLEEACPELHPSAMSTMLGVLASLMHSEVEMHCHGAHLLSDGVVSLLQKLSCTEAVLLAHGVLRLARVLEELVAQRLAAPRAVDAALV